MVKRPIEITLIEILLLLYGALDVLIRINEFMAKQEPKPTTTEYLLVNAGFFLMSFMVIIAWKVYTNPKEIEEKGG